jgi:crotonobetaine/carnitine-CoA ligase
MGMLRRHPDPSVPTEVRLVAEDGRDVPAGATGEVWLRSPAVFAGYFLNEAATREALAPGGWLRTGDLALRDKDGHYTFVARKKDIIRRRGENLSPFEVESVLLQHPAVLEAAVIGVPSSLGEDDVAAFVVLRNDGSIPTPTEDDLRAHCASRLAAFKVPSLLRFLPALPRTPTQRVARHLLKL